MATSARIDELRKKFDENPRRYFAPLANEYRKAGDPERAAAICEEYLPQQPGHMSGHIVYGQALFELARFDEARQVFETALSLDPENLIALRHLGDIARTAGDAHAARVWYQRVLEADPRNEEIAQLMMSLLSTPIGSQTVDHSAATPLNTPAVTGRPSASASAPAVESPTDDPQFATTEEVEIPRASSPSLTPFSSPAVSPQSFVSRHAPKEDELLDLDSFDLGGVPLSSLRNAKSPETDPMAEPSSAAEESEDSGLVAFDEAVANKGDEPLAEEPFVEETFVEDAFVEGPFVEESIEPDVSPTAAANAPRSDDAGIEKAHEFADVFETDAFGSDTFEADSLAITAKPLHDGEAGSFREEPPGTIELAADIDLGLPDDGSGSSTFADGEMPVEGLESFEPGIVIGGASGEALDGLLATESFFETPGDIWQPSADALLDSLADDPGAIAGMSAFSQVRDETTEPSVAESASIEAALEQPGSEAMSVEEQTLDDIAAGERTTEELSIEASVFDEPMTEEPSAEQPSVEEPLVEARQIENEDAGSAPAIHTSFGDQPAIPTPFGHQSAIGLSTPFPLSASPEPLTATQFHEAEPVSIQGDPLMAPAFGSTTEHTESEPVALSMASIDDVDGIATPDSAEAEAHVPAADASSEQPGAFVTETMAMLYIEQGHFDAAIDIYRQLVQQRPDDIGLRDRLHAAEERAWGHQRDVGASIFEDDAAAAGFGDADDDDESDLASPPRTYGGPTIREFLNGILFGQSPAAVAEMEQPATQDAYDEPPSVEQSHEDIAAMAEVPPVSRAERSTPASSSGDSVSSSLGALFSEADAATPAPQERTGLEGRVATPIGGTPAHRAPNELSLDHVFKANTGRSPEGQGFSFDQFFSNEAVEQAPPTIEPASEPRSDTSDDIAQFNAWLNGLKKS